MEKLFEKEPEQEKEIIVNYYDLLGVSRKTEPYEMKKVVRDAYKKRYKEVNGNESLSEEEKTQKSDALYNAETTLLDKRLRDQYDTSLRESESLENREIVNNLGSENSEPDSTSENLRPKSAEKYEEDMFRALGGKDKKKIVWDGSKITEDGTEQYYGVPEGKEQRKEKKDTEKTESLEETTKEEIKNTKEIDIEGSKVISKELLAKMRKEGLKHFGLTESEYKKRMSEESKSKTPKKEKEVDLKLKKEPKGAKESIEPKKTEKELPKKSIIEEKSEDDLNALRAKLAKEYDRRLDDKDSSSLDVDKNIPLGNLEKESKDNWASEFYKVKQRLEKDKTVFSEFIKATDANGVLDLNKIKDSEAKERIENDLEKRALEIAELRVEKKKSKSKVKGKKGGNKKVEVSDLTDDDYDFATEDLIKSYSVCLNIVSKKLVELDGIVSSMNSEIIVSHGAKAEDPETIRRRIINLGKNISVKDIEKELKKEQKEEKDKKDEDQKENKTGGLDEEDFDKLKRVDEKEGENDKNNEIPEIPIESLVNKEKPAIKEGAVEKKEEKESKVPKMRNLWEFLQEKKENNDDWQIEWKKVFGKLAGQRTYRFIDINGKREMQYMQLKLDGQKINESSELTFDVFDKNGNAIGIETRPIDKIKYADFKKVEKDKEPKKGDKVIILDDVGKRIEKNVTEIDEDKCILENMSPLPTDQLRVYENDGKIIYTRQRPKLREAQERHKKDQEKKKNEDNEIKVEQSTEMEKSVPEKTKSESEKEGERRENKEGKETKEKSKDIEKNKKGWFWRLFER